MTDRTDDDLFAFGQELGFELALSLIENKSEIQIMRLLMILDESGEAGPLGEIVALAGLLNAWSRIIRDQATLIDFDQRKADNQITFH
jgi:hypothetical protein